VVLLPVLPVLHYGIILPEEHYLEPKFGETYKEYQRKVRRYL
jgi:protein-S-isoprenylcysteine O-methyltransferase Ste14